MIDFVRVDDAFPDWESLDLLNRAAFPPDEYLAMETQLALVRKGEFVIWAAYTEGKFAGFATLRFYQHLVYLCYLAVEESRRSKGIGSQILQKLREVEAARQIIVEMELIDAHAANNNDRIRRKAFYLRNGFDETGWGVRYFGVSYELCATDGRLDIDLYQEMMKHANIPNFDPVYFRIP